VLRPRLGRNAQTAAIAPARDLDTFNKKSLDELVAEGAVRAQRVTSGEVEGALRRGRAGREARLAARKGRRSLYEFVTALHGQRHRGNLIGVVALENTRTQLPRGAEAIYIASNGPYDFFGRNIFRRPGKPLRSFPADFRTARRSLRLGQLHLCLPVQDNSWQGSRAPGTRALMRKDRGGWRFSVNAAGPRPATLHWRRLQAARPVGHAAAIAAAASLANAPDATYRTAARR